MLGSFEIGQQAYLLEHGGREVLRLVDHEDRATAGGVCFEQVQVQRVDQGLDAAPVVRDLDVQFLADRGEEFDDGQLRVEHDGDIGVIRQAIQEQRPHERRLAGADLARELDETATLGDPVYEVRQRLSVTLAQEQVTRIRRYRKRFFVESEKTGVHGSLPRSGEPSILP